MLDIFLFDIHCFFLISFFSIFIVLQGLKVTGLFDEWSSFLFPSASKKSFFKRASIKLPQNIKKRHRKDTEKISKRYRKHIDIEKISKRHRYRKDIDIEIFSLSRSLTFGYLDIYPRFFCYL